MGELHNLQSKVARLGCARLLARCKALQGRRCQPGCSRRAASLAQPRPPSQP